MTFSEWLKMREMLSPVPFPALTNMSPEIGAKLKQLTALPDGEARIPRYKRNLKKGNNWFKLDKDKQ